MVTLLCYRYLFQTPRRFQGKTPVVKILLHSMRVTKMIGEALFSAWLRGKFSLGREKMRPPAPFWERKGKIFTKSERAKTSKTSLLNSLIAYE